ncbi:beta-N-acetylhexosaminidase [Alistipes sp.]|uniref:beta-N-acetylhexosaminidase n=1 Tax=Alistipes sp. TaxID=1872444 RepID=UPI003AB55CFF
MNRILPLLSLLLCLSASGAELLPVPRCDTPADGTFLLDGSVTLCCETALEPLARYVTAYVPLRRTASRCPADRCMVLRTDEALAPEAYVLRIAPGRVEIAGGAYGGVFNGVQTLFQLLPDDVYAGRLRLPVRLDCRTVEDGPRFGYRGMMLDVARTWIDLPHVKRYIDLLAYHKINKLHFHLADDEGWRIEIRSHPELTAIGAWRGGDSPIRAVYGRWDEKYGGYYTQDELRELVAYAAVRNIEIIPEIDLPGHSRAIAHVRPEILCAYRPDTGPSGGYDERNVWCAAREENYALLEDILSEVCAIFPSPYIHIGGDEVETAQWRRCPDCMALMKRRGMSAPEQLQDYFMERLAGILRDQGKLPAVWDEASLRGKLTHDARVHGWQSVGTCLAASAKGYRTVVMPGAWFYFDMRQSPEEDGHVWAAIFDAEKTHGFDFAAQGFTPAQMARVEGVEATFFSELYLSHGPESPAYLDYMCFPRLCALAELGWSGEGGDAAGFRSRLTAAHNDRMAAMHIGFRLFPPEVTYRDGVLHVVTDDGSVVRFTEDGVSTPDASAPVWKGPLRTDEPHRYLFRSFYKTGRSPVVAHASHYRTISPAFTLTSSMPATERNPFSRAESYKGHARTRRAPRPGDWVLYTFPKPLVCREITIRTGYEHLPKANITAGNVEVSCDGRTFVPAGTLEDGCLTLRPERPLRAVRIVSTCEGNGCSFVVLPAPSVKPLL